MTKNSRQKVSGERKAFLIVFKGLSCKQIRQFFMKGEGPTLNFIFRADFINKINETMTIFLTSVHLFLPNRW